MGGAKKRILFVDDEPMIVKIMKNRLEAKQFIVETASNGLEALIKTKSFKPDLILLDITMPGADGYEVCRKLKENADTAKIPVIMFTASQEEDFYEKAVKAGATETVNKPFVAELMDVIQTVFSGEEDKE